MKRVLHLGLRPPPSTDQITVIHFPIIRTVPRDFQEPAIHSCLQRFDSFTHYILTSQTAVELLLPHLARVNIERKTVIAVGKKTAKKLREGGIDRILVPKEQTAEGVVELLKKENLSYANVFWGHAAKARTLIADYLHTHCHHVSDIILYDTVPEERLPKPDLNTIDEIFFTSPSTVTCFFHLFQEPPAHVALTAIGPITEDALKQVGHSPCKASLIGSA